MPRARPRHGEPAAAGWAERGAPCRGAGGAAWPRKHRHSRGEAARACHCWVQQRFLPAGRGEDFRARSFLRRCCLVAARGAGVMLYATGSARLHLWGQLPAAMECTEPVLPPVLLLLHRWLPRFGQEGWCPRWGRGDGDRDGPPCGGRHGEQDCRVAVQRSSLAGVGLPLHRSPRPWVLLMPGLGWPQGWGQLPARRAGAGASWHNAGTKCGGCVALACAAPGGAGCFGGSAGPHPGEAAAQMPALSPCSPGRRAGCASTSCRTCRSPSTT